ncbi:MAG: hypothetical protein ABIP75_15520 [Pyrinomonadaceae bacterium]
MFIRFITSLIFISLIITPAALLVRGQATATIPAPRHIIICVDGVGFETIQKMRAEGHFKMFRDPAHMIAPFPSLTNVSIARILAPAGAAEPLGYEDDYYDVARNRMSGSLLDRFNQARFVQGSYRSLFDYHPSAIKSGLGYALPPLSTYVEGMTDLVMFKRKLRSSTDPVYFAYSGSTDTLAHLGGDRMLRSFMGKLDDLLSDIVRESGGNVQVTIFSDHGNDYRKYKRSGLKDPLRRAGFRLDSNIKDERSVVLPQFGLIGCATLFTRPENEPRVAEVAAGVKGVDFAAYESHGVVYLAGSDHSRATIERRGDRYRYVAQTGDPLELRSVVAEFIKSGKTDADGFIADADWFAATTGTSRPDSIRRIYDGLTGAVQNRANVIVNFADGYYSGSALMDLVAFLLATHGNLGRGQSFGFVIDSKRDLPPYVRAGDLWSTIGSPVLKKSDTMKVAEKTKE